MKVGVALVIALVIAVAACIAVAPDRFYGLFGGPDLGNVAFESLERRSTPNDALACPPSLCKARADLVPPLYAMPARDLRAAFATVIASEPRVSCVEADAGALTDRYVQTSRLMGFPDTVVVRFLDQPDGRSTLALYSRSKFGAGDFGVNRARIGRWLDKLAAIAKPVP